MGSTKGCATTSVVAHAGGLKESGGTDTDPVRPRLLGLEWGLALGIAVLEGATSDICRTEGFEICFIVTNL